MGGFSACRNHQFIWVVKKPTVVTTCYLNGPTAVSSKMTGWENRQETTGWWLTNPSEKYEFVNGKDDIP